MLDCFKLEPIHTSGTPRGRLLKPSPKKVVKSQEKQNPELSFVLMSKNSLSKGSIINESFLQQSSDLSKTNITREFAKTSKSLNKQGKNCLKSQNVTLNLNSTGGFKVKSFSQAMMRKKLRSVCYTRRQMTKMQLNKCMHSLYLKVQSERISLETPKIKSRQNAAKPYTRPFRLNEPPKIC